MVTLLGEQAFKLLRKYKIPTVSYKFIEDSEQLEKLATPCVLKVPSILHKTEKGAVRIVHCKKNLLGAYRKLSKFGEVIYQPFIDGQYIIIGIKRDETFGPVVMFGSGGIFAEVMKDVSFRVAPIKKKDAQEMIEEIKGYKILKGVRGQKAINFKLLKYVLLKVSKLAMKENIKELDINPFIINNKSGCAVDVRIIK